MENVIAHDKPFRHWVIDSWCPTIEWEYLPPTTWPGWEVRYDNDQERGKYTTRLLGALPNQVLEAAERLRDSGQLHLWATRLGIKDWMDVWPDRDGWGGGFHMTVPGGWLQTHLDWAIRAKEPRLERRLTLIAYLHPEWRPEWGGRLILAAPDGTPMVKVDPLPGRLVAFENSDLSYHGAEQVAAGAKPRVSFMAAMLAFARPGTTRTRALFMPNRNAPNCPREVAR